MKRYSRVLTYIRTYVYVATCSRQRPSPCMHGRFDTYRRWNILPQYICYGVGLEGTGLLLLHAGACTYNIYVCVHPRVHLGEKKLIFGRTRSGFRIPVQYSSTADAPRTMWTKLFRTQSCAIHAYTPGEKTRIISCACRSS